MKTKKNLFGNFLLVIAGIIVLMSLSKPIQQQGKWQAPKSADTLKNPLKYNWQATANGKILYKKMCVTCHGDEGKGDGIAGISLNPRPADHTSAKIQALSDGALYWIITYGNPPMPTYKVILKDEQRWQLVNYIRELGKNTSPNKK
ncbi:MAG: cytochrome c [Bacteroidetes bacterium]|nr:cytochrome c [Bacteroidota bacterium]